MKYRSLSALTTDGKSVLQQGPLALVLIEDQIEVDSTVAHLRKIGFGTIIAFCAADIALPDGVIRVDHDVLADDALEDILNAVIAVAPDQWIHYCYNAEYFYYPFVETRSVGEMIAFCMEERRNSVLTYVVDLYARDLGAFPDAVDPQTPYLDRAGYYALARRDETGAELDRQMDYYGGLRWRFEEHIPDHRRRIDRLSLFRAAPGLRMDHDRRFNIAEYNTYACPWHNSLTATICSFRTAKALRRNPGSKHQIDSFDWPNAVAFNWQSQQLLDLGLMEPGQWF
ncbi:hypothetical protein [Yoonia sp. SS1-5]|uniref:Uncharacterized protein n=1 Tax=Yoonia rhodophyticola TaxID=3137370 RepID=A0AAN0MCD8_9RHOB